MHVEYRHTLAVERDAWFMRFYAWLWDGDVHRVNFCKLFWAYVFAVPALLFKLLIYYPIGLGVLAPLVRRAERRSAARRAAARAVTPPEPVKRERRTMQRILHTIETTASYLALRVSAVRHFVSQSATLNRVVARGLLVVGGVLSLVLVGGIVYLAVTFFSVTQVILIVVASLIITVALIAAFAAMGVLEVAWTALVRFRDAMGQGLAAVKSNTCPQIVVRSEHGV